jgi:hypothetical protein
VRRSELDRRTLIRGGCLDLVSAGEIVQSAIPRGPHDMDCTLDEAGLTSEAQREVFREDVVAAVDERGCSLDPVDVPNDADTTLRQVRKAVRDHAKS